MSCSRSFPATATGTRAPRAPSSFSCSNLKGAAILFPRSQLPLHIFEPRYRDMVRDSIEGAGQIAMIQPLRDDDDNRAPLHAVGCIGEIGGVEELDDGRFN